MICKEDNLFIIRIFKDYLNDIDIYDRDSIVSLLKGILLKLRKHYELGGLFDIQVYMNEDYGMIMEVMNVCQYEGEIDVKISFNIDGVFLYEINNEEDSEGNIYYYKGKYYSDKIDKYYDSYVVYKDSLDIICKGIKIK